MRTLGFAFTSLALVLVACGSSTTSEPTDTNDGTGTSKTDAGSGSTKTGGDDSGTSGGNGDDGSDASSAGGGGDDASANSGDDDASGGTSDAGRANDAGNGRDASNGSDSGSGDGTGTRKACTSTFGNALSGSFGRLDGYIVSVVTTKGSSSCNADSTHVHVQVSMNGSIYDVAINIDGGYWLSKDIALPEGAWSEGWHASDGLDYVSTLDLHSTDFTSVAQSALETDVENALASANHISAYGTTYTGSDSGSGIHDIHRESSNKDGAIFLDPTTSSPHALLFRFSTDSF